MGAADGVRHRPGAPLRSDRRGAAHHRLRDRRRPPKSQACEEAGDDPVTVLSYDTSDNAALAALIGRADALSADSPVTAWAVSRSDGRLELTGDMFDAAPYGWAVPKDSPLGPAMATALQHLIDTGDYERILAQWGVTTGLIDRAMINEKEIA